jgi:cytochrome c biogenesis protein CcdA
MANNQPDEVDPTEPEESKTFLSFFPGTPAGIRRSILFTLAVATGFISIVAATSATLSDAVWWLPTVLWVAGIVLFLFAILLALGRFRSLVEDDQYFWSFKDQE